MPNKSEHTKKNNKNVKYCPSTTVTMVRHNQILDKKDADLLSNLKLRKIKQNSIETMDRLNG